MAESFSQSTERRNDDDRGAPRRQSAPFLFLVLQCDAPAAAARFALDVDEVVLGRGRTLTAVRAGEPMQLTLSVPDKLMSSRHARLYKRFGQWTLEDLASTNGTLLNGAPVASAVLGDGDLVALGHTLFVFRRALATPPDGAGDLDASPGAAAAPGLGTLLPALGRELAALGDIAPSPVTVTIFGESGTGKELIARALHKLSRRPGPFVAINCGALPPTLLESELFGYRKGAFSGATEDRAGLIRSADRGTLFLDELGDLPPASQAAFLRVLQEREVTPLGATRAVPVDLRLVAATHHDLEALVAAGRFRADLLARLAGWTLRLPPLRERREDLGLLIASLARRLDPDGGAALSLSAEAAAALWRYPWPLNVRELEKCLQAAMVLARGRIEVEHLAEAVRRGPPAEAAPRALDAEDEARRQRLAALLAEARGNVSAVARQFGCAPVQIRRWAKRYGIDMARFRR